MPKVFIEDTEIEIIEESEVDSTDSKHEIVGKYYVMQTVTTTDFKSTIFTYDDSTAVLISKLIRFGQDYYKVVLFSDELSKAWTLTVLSAKLDIKIKRLAEAVFVVIGEGCEDVISQISFCKLKPNTKVEDITINFKKLEDIHFIKDKTVLINYVDEDGEENLHILQMYNYDGRLLKTYYEYRDSDEETFSYDIRNDKITITRKYIKKPS